MTDAVQYDPRPLEIAAEAWTDDELREREARLARRAMQQRRGLRWRLRRLFGRRR